MSRRPGAWLAAGIVLLTALAYAPSLRFGYTWDAKHAVEQNRIVRDGSLAKILASDYWAGTSLPDRTLYRPVTVLSFGLERRVTGEPSAPLSHAVNAVLHATVAWLLWGWLRRLGAGRGTAAAAALLFAAHPLMLQSVVNVVGRAELLATGFTLGALWAATHAGAWCEGPEPGPGPARAASWGTGLLVLLALGSKEVALATPLLVAVQELLFRYPGRSGSRGWWIDRGVALAPVLVATLAFVLLRTKALGVFPGVQPVLPIDNVLAGLEGLPRVATVLGMGARYLRLLVWPVRLSADYSGSSITVEDNLLAPLPAVGALAAVALAVSALAPLWWRGCPDRARRLSAGASLVLLPYAVVGNVLVLNGAGFAERLIYCSSAGFCLLVAEAVSALVGPLVARPAGRRAAVAVLALLLLAAAIHTRREARAWRDDETLLQATLRSNPLSLRAHFALAEARMDAGRDSEALALYDRAVELVPDHASSWLYKGVLHARRGELGEAEAAIRRSLALRRDVGETHLYLGMTLEARGRLDAAERAYRKAMVYHPGFVEAAARLGGVLFALERYAESAHWLRQCIDRGRADLTPWLERANARAGAR